MSTPNWIMVTLKTTCPDSHSYMGKLMQTKLTEQECSFHAEKQKGMLPLTCRRINPLRYDFSVLDGNWSKEDVMAFCGMLLQCVEVDNVLVGWVESKAETKVMVSPTAALWHAVKARVQSQRFTMHVQYSHSKG